jgi:hypothetical protein
MDQQKDDKKKKKKTGLVEVGSGNFVSKLIFAWVFWLIYNVRRAKDMKSLDMSLRKTEQANFNLEKLAKKWQEEQELAAKQNRYIAELMMNRRFICQHHALI